MPLKHPYTSGSGGIARAIDHLRKSFPSVVNADTLKKLGISPNNEGYVINILRFIGVIDEEGRKTKEAATVFSRHTDSEFREGFASLIKAAYAELFELHSDGSWQLDLDKLISFFRQTDESSDIVGRRQALTFQTLASLAGKAEARQPKAKPNGAATSPRRAKKADSPTAVSRDRNPTDAATVVPSRKAGRDVGLTVRVEVNLPANADQDTYDRIFRSIRENLINEP